MVSNYRIGWRNLRIISGFEFTNYSSRNVYVWKREWTRLKEKVRRDKSKWIRASSSSSSSCSAASTDLPDALSPPVFILHYSWEVFKAISCIGTKLLYTGSCWSLSLCSSMWKGPREYIGYEFVFTSPAVSCISGSSNLDSFRDGL